MLALSFYVVSLLKTIPVKKACEYIQNKLDCDDSLYLRTDLDSPLITVYIASERFL